MKLRIVFIGCVQFSQDALNVVLKDPAAQVVGIVTKRHSKFNSDFVSLELLASNHNVPCLCLDKNDQDELLRFIQQRAPDVVYCFGWSYLLNQGILQSTRLGVIGFHPAKLPYNRGRHPLIWALALGLKQSASTFFFMDQGADSGDIISQVDFAIEDNDDASTLYQKMTETACRQISLLSAELASSSYKRVKQDHTKANYWRKRTALDGKIDWRMPASGVFNLVRALTKPYPGAHFERAGTDYKVWKAKIGQGSADNIESGKVLEVSGERIHVKCGIGSLWIEARELASSIKAGDYL